MKHLARVVSNLSLHELKKGCKIVDEIALFLMRNGHLDLNIAIKQEDKSFFIEIITSSCSEELCNQMDAQINMCRELEIEEYGWELMGESDATNELELIGLLVDKLTIEHKNGKTIFRMVRHDRY